MENEIRQGSQRGKPEPSPDKNQISPFEALQRISVPQRPPNTDHIALFHPVEFTGHDSDLAHAECKAAGTGRCGGHAEGSLSFAEDRDLGELARRVNKSLFIRFAHKIGRASWRE